MTRQALNNLVNGKAGISPEMAVRLSKAFGATPETWLRLQMAYDLSQVRHQNINVKGCAPRRDGRFAPELVLPLTASKKNWFLSI